VTTYIWWLGTTHPCNPPHYRLWVNLHFFMVCIYKHCFLPMLFVFAMKCCTKMPCPLPHNHYCCLLSSPIRLPHLLICTCLISSPIACPPSSVLCWCLLFFFNYFCDMLHFFMTPFWLICEHIFSFVLHFHSFRTLFGIWSAFDFSFDCVQIFWNDLFCAVYPHHSLWLNLGMYAFFKIISHISKKKKVNELE